MDLPAHVRLSHLHDPAQRLRVYRFHRGADAMAEVPGRLVGDAERPLDLVRAHPLLGLAEQVDAQKPLPQGQVRVIENRPRRDRKLVPASIAVELVPLRNLRGFRRLAAGANCPSLASEALPSTRGTFPHCQTAQSEHKG